MFGKSKTPTKEITFDELLEQRRTLDSEIAARQATEVETLKMKINAVANALRVPVAELIGIKPDAEPRRRKPVARIKYRDPANPANTWTGKGKQPKWLQEKLDQGASKDQFQAQ
jgi:DNA-binding protein H-NS